MILFAAYTTNLVSSHTFSISHVVSQAIPPPQQPLFTDEDCNLPNQERSNLLERLQILLGDVPPHFWAACHLCDVQKQASLVQTAELNPNIVCIAAGETYTLVKNCKTSTIGVD